MSYKQLTTRFIF